MISRTRRSRGSPTQESAIAITIGGPMASLLVILGESDLSAIPWAQQIAGGAGSSLCILCPSKGAPVQVRQAVPDDESPELIGATLDAAESYGIAPASVFECRGRSYFRAVLDAAKELDAQQIVLHSSRDGKRESVGAAVLRLARGAPYDVLVLDTGGIEGPPSRVVVPQMGGGGAHALTCAARFFGGPDRPVLALPDPRSLSRSRRVFQKVQRRVAESRSAPMTQGAPAGSIDEALQGSLESGDLVLLDADRPREVPRVLSRLRALRAECRDVAFAMGVTRSEDAVGPGSLERAFERFRRYAPVLTRDERRNLHQFLEQGGQLSTDFVVMMTLSAAIAALGLIQSSSSVVIGAMLVAPLMTPLVAIGMALAQGNSRLFRVALHSMCLGVLGALLVSVCVGALSPWQDLSAEIAARGSPNIFDLGIALLSGVAASFALARPGLAGTLVGVAIAVALVPPLAAAGIATVKGHFDAAIGAGVLFSTNLLAIVVGSALVFRIFGVDPAVRGARVPRWVRGTYLLVACGLLATAGVLVHNLRLQTTEGVHRAYARPLSQSLRSQIRARVAETPGVEILFMMESNIEHGFGLEIALCSDQDIDPALVDDLHRMLERSSGMGRSVRVLTLRSTTPGGSSGTGASGG